MSHMLRRWLPVYTKIWGNPLEVRSARRKLALEVRPARGCQGPGLLLAFAEIGLFSHRSKYYFPYQVKTRSRDAAQEPLQQCIASK